MAATSMESSQRTLGIAGFGCVGKRAAGGAALAQMRGKAGAGAGRISGFLGRACVGSGIVFSYRIALTAVVYSLFFKGMRCL